MKFCNQCGSKNTGNAKFCQECGNSLQGLVVPRGKSPDSADEVAQRVSGYSLLNLSQCIAPARSRLRELRQTIPPASSDAVAPLMGRLQSIAPDDSTARIELIEALGRTRDPVVLRALLLVAGAGSKHVRRAVAVALSGINHTLSAYILLPMLEDPSSRVRNSAIQALIYINQPHCAEVIVSACLGNRELKRIAFDTVQRLRPVQRDAFVYEIARVNPGGVAEASDLIREFRAFAGSTSSGNSVNPVGRSGQQSPSSQEPERASFKNSRGLEEAKDSESARQQASLDREESLETSTVSGFASVEPASQQADIGIGESAARKIKSASPLRAELVADADSPGVDRAAASESGFSGSSKVRVKVRAQDFVSRGIDMASLDDTAVTNLMSDLVPETEGLRSSESVADFRFFESVSTNLNDSRAGWQSPENSVFDYDPIEDEHFSDTQTFSKQNTSRSEFAVGQSSTGDYARGRSESFDAGGSSAVWSQPIDSPEPVRQSSGMRAGIFPAGDPAQSAPYVPNSPQSFSQSPIGAGWPSGPQQQFAPQGFPGPHAYPGLSQPPFFGYAPQHFPAMQPPMPMPQLGYPSASFPAQQFAPGMMNPQHEALSRSSAEMATMAATPQATEPGSSLVQNSPESVNPLSEAVLINGGTVLDIPLVTPSGTTVATTDSQSAAPAAIELTSTVKADNPEQAAKKAQNDRNLERLRQARDHAFRALLDVPEPISGAAPRLISKKITTLLTTPSVDHAQIKLQLVALGKTGSPHALDTLASFCQKPAKEIRISCAEALGLIKHQGAVVQLLKFLGDKSGTVIETALKSMISLQDKSVYSVILAAGLVNSSLRTIVASSIETVSEEHKPAWEQQLLACLKLDDPDLVAFSIQLLVKLTGVTHVDSFMTYAASTEPVIRAAAVEALVKTGAKKVIGTINDAMVDDDPLVRSQAAIAVGTMHSPRSIELLGKMLQDSNLTVRRSAAQSAAKIEDPDLGDSIVAALSTETDHLAIEYLLEALNKNGGKNAYSLLVQFVEGSDTDLREIALKALRKLKLQESVPVFTRLLDDKHPHIRKQAIEQLTLLKVNGAIPRLKQMVKADTDEHVRGACARALGDLQDKTSLDLLEAALEDHAVVRFQAVLALGKIGNSAAAPSLIALLKDSQPEIRYQAVRALGQLKLEGSVDHLEPLLQDPDIMVRRGVEQALQEFGLSPAQIRRKRVQKSFTRVMLALSPAYLGALLPGKGGSLVAMMSMLVIGGGVWLLANVGSMVSGSTSLPVTRVAAVAISSSQKRAFVLRKLDVFDVWSIDDGAMIARIKVPVGVSGIIPESEGGVLLLGQDAVTRLDASTEFKLENAKTLKLEVRPIAVYFLSKSNSLCLFEKQDSGVQLRLINASTLDEVKKWSIAADFRDNCILSPDQKYAASLRVDGTLTFCELESGRVMSANVAKLANRTSLGRVIGMSFSDDMSYFAFCGTEGVYILKVSNMSLAKKVSDGRAYVNVLPVSGTPDFNVIAETGNLLTFSDELKTVTDTPLGGLSEFNGFDAGGDLIISGSSEDIGASIYSIKQKKIVLGIQPE